MNKKTKTMIERLREIRDQISLETMDMSFEQLQQYFEERRKKFAKKTGNKKYKTSRSPSIAAEPEKKYGNK